MARRSKFVSPQKRDEGIAEESDQDNEHSRPYNEQSDAEEDPDAPEPPSGYLKHLGSDLPDVHPEAHESQDDEPGEGVSSDNAQSTHEQPTSRFRSRQGHPNAEQRAKRASGKLIKPTKTTAGQRFPALYAKSKGLRQLGPPNVQRKSSYDGLDDGRPEGRLGISALRPDFSPLKVQRRRGVKGDPVSESTRTSPRKSRLAYEVAGDEDASDGQQAEAAVSDAVEDGQDGNAIVVDIPSATSTRQDVGTASLSKRGRGRPRKNPNISDVAAQSSIRQTASAGQPARSDQSGPAKRPLKLGSPAKAQAGPTPLVEEPSAEEGAGRAAGLPTLTHAVVTQARSRSAQGEDAFQPPDEEPAASEEEQPAIRSVFAAHRESWQKQMAEADEESEAEDDASPQKVQRVKTKKSRTLKRKRPSAPAQANTSSKRTKTRVAQPVSSDEDQEQSPVETTSVTNPADRHKLFGQWPQLNRIFKAVRNIGATTKQGIPTRHQFDINDVEDEQVQAALAACDKVIETYNGFDTNEDDASLEQELQDPMTILLQHVHNLSGTSRADVIFDKKNKVRCTEIYAFLVPKFLDLIKCAIEHYFERDRSRVPQGKIMVVSLRTVNKLIGALLLLIEGASEYVRPSSEDGVIQPVKNGINAPLKRVKLAFDRVIAQYGMRERDRARDQEEARHRALRLEQEERIAIQQAEIDRMRKEWRLLHRCRLDVEPITLSRTPEAEQKRRHLQPPQDIDVDFNGDPYERYDAFGCRVGPTRDQVDRAKQVVWKMTELDALADGLRACAGRNVLRDIIRRNCGKRGQLSRFNVTEIVTTAASLRDLLMKNSRETGEEVERWVLDIPVWTKGHQALGKENEPSEVGTDEERADGESVAGSVMDNADDLFVEA